MELHVKTSYLLQTNQCNGMKSSDINSQWTVRKINPVLSIILIFPMNSSNTASRLSLIIVNKKFTFSGESFTRANKKGFSHVCIGVCRGKCWLFSSDFVYPAGEQKTNWAQVCSGVFSLSHSPLTLTWWVRTACSRALTWQEYSPLSTLSARLMTSWLPCSSSTIFLLIQKISSVRAGNYSPS